MVPVDVTLSIKYIKNTWIFWGLAHRTSHNPLVFSWRHRNLLSVLCDERELCYFGGCHNVALLKRLYAECINTSREIQQQYRYYPMSILGHQPIRSSHTTHMHNVKLQFVLFLPVSAHVRLFAHLALMNQQSTMYTRTFSPSNKFNAVWFPKWIMND